MSYGIGLFMGPLQEEFGWGMAKLSAGFTISALLTVPLAPVVGAMIDKWGVRRLVLPGLVLKAVSIAVFATTSGSDFQWYALWVFYSLVALATLITMILGIGVIVHLVPILTEAGYTRASAAYLASLAGVAGIVGKLVTGYLMDRMHAGWIGAITLSAMALAFSAMLEPWRTRALIIMAVIISGYAAGCKLQICAYLTGRYGGMRNFGKIFGVMASMIALGAGLGPMLAGAVHDISGSYSPLMIIGIPGSLVSGLLLIGLGPYPNFEKKSEAGIG